MQHYVYKITNLVNQKYYIGVHSSINPDNDNYYGSGVLIKYSIKKYGVTNFKKDILHICETRQQALDKETEIVTLELISDNLCYNLIIGGSGSGTFNKKIRNRKSRGSPSEETIQKIRNKQKGIKRKPLTDEHKNLLSSQRKGITPKNMQGSRKKETIGKINKTKKLNYESGKTIPNRKGVKLSEETKTKISKSLFGNIPPNKGKKMNSDFCEKVSNALKGKNSKRLQLLANLEKYNFNFVTFREFVIYNFKNGLSAITIHKLLPNDICSVTPIKNIIKEYKNECSSTN